MSKLIFGFIAVLFAAYGLVNGGFLGLIGGAIVGFIVAYLAFIFLALVLGFHKNPSE